jgi:hypothetical protein
MAACVLSLDPKRPLKVLLVLLLLSLELLSQMRVPNHVLFTVAIDLEIGVGHLEPSVFFHSLAFYNFGHFAVDHFINLLLSALRNVCILDLISEFVVKLLVHQVAMHVLSKHSSIDEVLATKLLDFLLAYKFVLIVDHFSVVLLELLSDAVHIWNPLGTWA